MAPRLLLLSIASLVVTTLLAGCGGSAPPQVPETPVTTTISVTTLPPATMAPQVTTSPEPFPGALALGMSYQYGREDIAMDVTFYKVKVMDEYDWWSPKWGRYWNTSPGKGNQFLFALVRLVDRGTARARLPSQSMFVLHGDGGSYVQTTDRDNSLWIKGIDVKQYRFLLQQHGGVDRPGRLQQGGRLPPLRGPRVPDAGTCVPPGHLFEQGGCGLEARLRGL